MATAFVIIRGARLGFRHTIHIGGQPGRSQSFPSPDPAGHIPIVENPDNVKAPDGKRGLHGRLAPSKVYQSGSHNCWCK